MFVVNQDGNSCEEAKKIHYIIDYDREVIEDLEKIYRRIHTKVYNWGSEENCLRGIREEQNRYIRNNNCQKVVTLYVNERKFGVYKKINEGKSVFNMITEGIKKGITLIDLSKEMDR